MHQKKTKHLLHYLYIKIILKNWVGGKSQKSEILWWLAFWLADGCHLGYLAWLWLVCWCEGIVAWNWVGVIMGLGYLGVNWGQILSHQYHQWIDYDHCWSDRVNFFEFYSSKEYFQQENFVRYLPYSYFYDRLSNYLPLLALFGVTRSSLPNRNLGFGPDSSGKPYPRRRKNDLLVNFLFVFLIFSKNFKWESKTYPVPKSSLIKSWKIVKKWIIVSLMKKSDCLCPNDLCELSCLSLACSKDCRQNRLAEISLLT